MSRIIETENVTLTTVAVAPRITIDWNPHDDTGAVTFHVQKMESIDGEFRQMLPADPITLPLDDVLARTVSIPLPDGSTFEFPPQLIGAYIKHVFDDIYTERANDSDPDTE